MASARPSKSLPAAASGAGVSQPVFLPKIFSTLKGYTSEQLQADAVAGVIVGIVALPLAIAFGIASGVTPDKGLITAIVAGFLISALGGSRVQIGGPTGAFVVIVYRIIERYGVDGLLLCTMLAGLMLIAMGLLRLGTVIKFIPYPLTVGFTSGIAVVIFSSEVKDFLGLNMGPVPADFLQKWGAYFQALPTLNPAALGLSLLSLAIILAWPRVSRRIPGSIVAVVAVTALVQRLHLPVETIASRFGALPMGLPRPVLPHLTLAQARGLIAPAFTVAMLGAIESLLSATVADGMIEGRHRSNTELIGQGVANVAVSFFGGIPATGAIARTATNVKNGGRTPVAGMVHALTLLLIMLIFGRWAGMIPLCVLASILAVVCYHMSEWRSFLSILKAPRMDVAVLLSTFILTVLVDLTAAVEVGMLLAMVLFMKRMTDVTVVREIRGELAEEEVSEDALRREPDAAGKKKIPAGAVVYEAEGALFFGVAESLRDTFSLGSEPPKILILRMRHVLALDASGIRALNDLRKTCARAGTRLLLAGIHSQPLVALENAGVLEEFGADNVQADLESALARARELLG